MGLDLGQAKDPSAIAVLERVELMGPWDGTVFARKRGVELWLRRLDRLPLGLRYPEVEATVERTVTSLARIGKC